MVLGKSFSGLGKKLVLTSGEFSNPVVLSDNQDVSCALLEDGLIVACYTSSVMRMWSSKSHDGVSFDSYDVGVQMKLLGDNIYILMKTGSVNVFSLRFSRFTKQISAPANSRVHVFDVERGLLASGLSDKTVMIWSMAESRIVHRLKGNGHVPTCISLTRPVLVVAAGQGCVHVWHVTTGQLLQSLDTCGAVVGCLVVCEDTIVAGDVRGQVFSWNRAVDNHPQILTIMTDAVRGLHFDKYNLISLSFDANCEIFDTI